MGKNPPMRSAFTRLVHSAIAGSAVLIVSTLIAMAWANSPWDASYEHLTHMEVAIVWDGATLSLSLREWVNDALMVLFFFVVGLEMKREVLVGQLSSMKQAALPVMAAAAGMIVPAVLFCTLNLGGEGQRGWGVPMATDIAFALGILALFRSRVPPGLKVFLTALAVSDDLGAVLVIALFYSETIRIGALVVAGISLLLIFLAGRARVRRLGVYILLIAGVWVGVFFSGVHATVAGILVAMLVPVRARIDPKDFLATAVRRLGELVNRELTTESPISDQAQLDALVDLQAATHDMTPVGITLERYFHPVQVFLVLPLFAFFNAGVHIDGRILDALGNPVSLGIVLGLVVGKQLGVFAMTWSAVKIGRLGLPEGVTWLQVYGVSCLAGIGFTMSLFVSELAFLDPRLVGDAKIGILAASILAGIWGTLVLRKALPHPRSWPAPPGVSGGLSARQSESRALRRRRIAESRTRT
jgi:Na+:H+ antiporter, NhaA family